MILIIVFNAFIGFAESSFGTHARIGNYSQYIPGYDMCGLFMNSFKPHNKCFEYHQKLFSPMYNARRALDGEAPWVALVQMITKGNWWWENDKIEWCTGSLIAPQWVISAAHCFDSNKMKIKIRFGTEHMKGQPYDGETPIKHPLFRNSKEYDIALVKLKSSVQIVNNGEYYSINTLCLPPNNITLLKHNILWKELALASGWGKGHNDHLRIDGRIFLRLYGHNYSLYEQSSISNAQICEGDSGSPTWQYHMGRGVLLGVTRGGMTGTQCSNISYGAYIPKVVDWIIQEITK